MLETMRIYDHRTVNPISQSPLEQLSEQFGGRSNFGLTIKIGSSRHRIRVLLTLGRSVNSSS